MTLSSQSRGWTGGCAVLFFVFLSVLGLIEMRLSEATAAIGERMEAVVTSSIFSDNGFQLQESYTGIAPLDAGLRVLVSAFLPGVAGWDKGFQIQQFYFLVSFFAIISIWSVEAGRGGRGRSWTRFTSIWALFYQTVGGAVLIPLYYLAYMRESSQPEYWSPASRRVSAPYAKALLPSLLLGYLLPTILMFLPFQDPEFKTTQILIALWQPSPWIVNLLLAISGTFKGPTSPPKAVPMPHETMKHLNRLYLICFAICSIVHVATISTCLLSSDPEMSLIQALFRVPVGDRTSMSGALHYIFQADYGIIFVAAVAAAFLTLWDIERLGIAKLSLSKAATLMAVGVICVGPAATVSGVWYAREHLMNGRNKR